MHRAFRWLFGLGLVCTASGCAGRFVRSAQPEHGDVIALASAKLRDNVDVGSPLVVLVERRGLRGLDPETARQLWWTSLPVAGHPVASASTIFAPLSDQRLAAIDRFTGDVLWQTPIPAEAISGLAVSGHMIIATVIDHRKGRSRVLGVSTHDGEVRWARRSDQRFGVPAAAGKVGLVPLADQIIAFRLTTGRELARVDTPKGPVPSLGSPTWEQVALRGGSLLAGQTTRWVDLGGTKLRPRAIEDGHAAPFRSDEGLDPGHDDLERLRLWVRFSETVSAPRAAVLLCRRSVVAMRLSPQGAPVSADWVYTTPTDREFVAIDVGRTRVTVVSETGEIVQLSTRTGRIVDRIKGGPATRGALILNAPERPSRSNERPPARAEVRTMLQALLRDRDPRLLPAQKLAAALSWSDDDPTGRAVVERLATGQLRGESTAAAEDLRSYALDLLAQPWGGDLKIDVDGLVAALAKPPSYIDDHAPALAPLARQAVYSGRPEIIPHLVEHLLHPATAAGDLTEIASALRELDRPDAVEGVATFLRRYHADPDVVYESRAIYEAVDFLAAQANRDSSAGRQARRALSEVRDDPFTDPQLRAYIVPRLAPGPAVAADGGEQDMVIDE